MSLKLNMEIDDLLISSTRRDRLYNRVQTYSIFYILNIISRRLISWYHARFWEVHNQIQKEEKGKIIIFVWIGIYTIKKS